MHGNIHTLKFQYTALETRKYDKLKTTETDKGNVKQGFTGKRPRIVRVNTFPSNFFGMWFYRKIEDFTFV
jgi:hypothetical protein